MECLTLQDVPSYHHRTAMSFHERSPSRHHAKLHETSERMKVGHVVNQSRTPSPTSLPAPPASIPILPCPWRQTSNDSPSAAAPAASGPTQAPYEWAEEARVLHEQLDRRSLMSYESTQVLTGPDLPRQNTVRLPPYEELARVADETNEEQNNAQIGSSPATIAYFQTSSSCTSRQSSTERPVFNDPFRGHPPSTSPFRPGNQHMRLPSSTENYTTTSEGRNIFLNTRISPILDHRRSSMRTEYEPRAPPALFPQPRTTSHDSGSPAARPSYYPPTALSHAHQVPTSPQETRRASEAHFSHPGYGVTYNHDPYRQRSWASESPGYPRQYQRHDSTVYAGPEHWYGYPGTYGYNVEGAHADGTGRKRRGNLPKEATNTLKEWFQRHADSPYPTDEEKSDLAGLTGLSSAQISNWFINARRRTPGKEAREAARQNNNRGNQQQAQQQDGGDEQARGNHVPQQMHYRQRAQERSRYPPSESHYGNQDDHQDGTQDQVMHDA